MLKDLLLPNQQRHEDNRSILYGWYKGVYYENGVPRPNELPPKVREQIAILKKRRIVGK